MKFKIKDGKFIAYTLNDEPIAELGTELEINLREVRATGDHMAYKVEITRSEIHDPSDGFSTNALGWLLIPHRTVDSRTASSVMQRKSIGRSHRLKLHEGNLVAGGLLWRANRGLIHVRDA